MRWTQKNSLSKTQIHKSTERWQHWTMNRQLVNSNYKEVNKEAKGTRNGPLLKL
jgi:hypothetical protein